MNNLIRIVAIAIVVTTSAAHADDNDPDVIGPHWVVGNRAAQHCEIVTSNPIVEPLGFASGPYRSRDDARLARNGISECPKVDNPMPPSEQK